MRILVIEDERAIADFIQRGLVAEGYSVSCAYDGDEGERLASTGDFHLVILDRMLPGRDGLSLLKELRRTRPSLPVIMLTARAEIEDRVEGLNAGATDYLAKPFSFDELAARVRAHLRKPSQSRATELKAAGITLDLLARRVEREGVEVQLSTTEFDLLAYLLRHTGQVLSREQILNAVWDYSHDPGTNVVGVYISYLRRKLEQPGKASPIETVRGAGYRVLERV